MPIPALVRHRKAAIVLGSLVICIAAACLIFFLLPHPPVELRVGYNSFVPFVIDDVPGHPRGLAVDILNEAARRAKVKLRYVPSGEDVDSALRAGKIDLFPMLALTPVRIAEFNTSQGWWDNEIALISLQSARIDSPSQTAGKSVAIRGLAAVKTLALTIFPRARFVIIPKLDPLVSALCNGQVDAAFLDIRLLQSQLLQGTRACAEKPLYVLAVQGGSISLGTVARPAVAAPVAKIYEQVANLAIDGTLSSVASRYSIVGSTQNRHMKDMMNAKRRASLLKMSLFALSSILLVGGVQTHRMRNARLVAEENRQRFDAFMKHTPAITFINDEHGGLVYLNRESGEDVHLNDCARHLASQLQATGMTVLQTGESVEVTETVSAPSREPHHFLCSKFPFLGPKGQRLVGTVALDITERRRNEEALKFSQFSIDRSPDFILWLDQDARIFYANQAAIEKLGYPLELLLRKKFDDIDCGFGSLACSRIRTELKSGGSITVESHHRTSTGDVFPVEVILNYLEFDGRGFVCCMSRDITARKRAERDLSYQAEHDQLTGLPNRRLFGNRLAQCVEAISITGSSLAVFYIDLDGFKLINDTHGHSLGDALLRQAVRRLTSCVRECDVLARMGGDEFTLIAPGIDTEADARLVGEKLLASLRESFFVGGHELLVTASAGVSFAPRDGSDGNTLLRNADAAMYEAKREGKNRLRFFTQELNLVVRERLELENRLRRAIERRELVLHYQPEISLKTNQVIRYEALLRWNHPTLGLVAPMKFIPIAEETGLIVPIGTWVLEEACRYTKSRADMGSSAAVGVNVSSVQFAKADFVETVADILERTGLPPSLLELELTETVVMQALDDVVEKIRQLRDMGISIAIDDFGTGYSSLSYLQKMRIDVLKIDRSFIREIPGDPNALALTKALVSLAHNLGMKVVVEGIETKPQLDAIRAIGGDYVQGYLLGRPAAPVEVVDYQLAEIA